MSAIPAVELYARALMGRAPVRAVSERGEILPLALERYVGSADEHGVLERALAPVLDVGCGPGRHLLELGRRGIHAVGVDISPAAAALARGRGARVIERSIFEHVPGAGYWGSALLLDGNIGIGGRPMELLARIGSLVRPGGSALVEIEAAGRPAETLRVRLEGGGTCSAWFDWARVGADDIAAVALGAGLRVSDLWCEDERWFAQLTHERTAAVWLSDGERGSAAA